MRNTRLPYSVEINGQEYAIRENGSFELVLDIYELFSDDDFTEAEQMMLGLNLFFEDVPDDIDAAMVQMTWFLRCGDETEDEPQTQVEKTPIADIVKDFPFLVPAINQVLGYDVRSPERFTHWWTFMAAYQELPENCFFSSVVDIRRKIRDEGFGKLTKTEKAFYQANRSRIELQSRFSAEEEEFFKRMGIE